MIQNSFVPGHFEYFKKLWMWKAMDIGHSLCPRFVWFMLYFYAVYIYSRSMAFVVCLKSHADFYCLKFRALIIFWHLSHLSVELSFKTPLNKGTCRIYEQDHCFQCLHIYPVLVTPTPVNNQIIYFNWQDCKLPNKFKKSLHPRKGIV